VCSECAVSSGFAVCAGSGPGVPDRTRTVPGLGASFRLWRSVGDMEPESREPSVETPVEDATEQSVSANPIDDAQDRDYAEDVHRGLEVNEWDATEQARSVNLDDERE
jgi:hypothetical protein